MVHQMLHQFGLHLIYLEGSAVVVLLLRGPGNRRRGLPFFGGLLPAAQLLAFAVAMAAWQTLPMPWHLPLFGVVFGVSFLVCMGLAFRGVLRELPRQDAPPKPPSTKAGKGAA